MAVGGRKDELFVEVVPGRAVKRGHFPLSAIDGTFF